jgi:ERCC4-type nuclease
MVIQIDTREHKFELARVQRQIEKQGASTFVKKLDVGDYMNVEVPDLSIDRKKNLQELCSNVCQQHERFRRELVRANKMGIQLIILIEHGGDISCLEDVYFWDNPRLKKSPKATKGDSLYRSLITIRDRYGVRFEFCDKRHTGRKIVELLSNGEKE